MKKLVNMFDPEGKKNDHIWAIQLQRLPTRTCPDDTILKDLLLHELQQNATYRALKTRDIKWQKRSPPTRVPQI